MSSTTRATVANKVVRDTEPTILTVNPATPTPKAATTKVNNIAISQAMGRGHRPNSKAAVITLMITKEAVVVMVHTALASLVH